MILIWIAYFNVLFIFNTFYHYKIFIAFISFKPILCLLNDMSFIFKYIFFVILHCTFFAYVHGYFCWHHVFYRLDVNECIERRICPGYCENTIGSYICTSKNRLKIDSYEDCPPGYQWESITGLCSGMSVYNLIIIDFFKYILVIYYL